MSTLCRVARVSRASYYRWNVAPASLRQRDDGALLQEIGRVFRRHRRRYGAPRVHVQLRGEGRRHSRKRIARLMQAAGLVSCHPHRYARTSLRSMPVYTRDLVRRRFRAEKPNQLWVGDITQVWTGQGWLFVAAIQDVFSRLVVGWSAGPSPDSTLSLQALEQALRSRQPCAGLIHHTDRGAAYMSHAYRRRMRDAGLRHSTGSPGAYWDNALAESFFATFKKELTRLEYWPTHIALRREVARYIAYFNRDRRHSRLGYQTPAQFDKLAA